MISMGRKIAWPQACTAVVLLATMEMIRPMPRKAKVARVKAKVS